MDIEEQVIGLVRSRKEGILQSELWKEAGIDRRKCSRIITKLEKEGKIQRDIQTESDSARRYRIKIIEKKEPEKIKDYSRLVVGKMFAPCTGCSIECIPERCPDLSEWVFGLLE